VGFINYHDVVRGLNHGFLAEGGVRQHLYLEKIKAPAQFIGPLAHKLVRRKNGNPGVWCVEH
jgi:hypothetical protein